MRIIAITGKKYSGKTTLANLLQKATTAKTIQIAFADSLKEEVAIACGVSVEYIEMHKREFRPILQWWGTDFRRRMNRDDYWIVKVKNKIVEHFEDGTKAIIIPDCRFKNEADYIKSIPGSWLVRVNRMEADGIADPHLSETDMNFIKPDITITNDDSIQVLSQKARSLIDMINKQDTPKHSI